MHVGFYVFAGPDWSNIKCRFCKACVRGPTGGTSKVSWGLASGLSPRLADANTQPPCTFFRWPAASRSVGSRLRPRCSRLLDIMEWFVSDSDEEDGPETPAMSAPPVLACNKLRYQRFGNNSNSVSVESERGLEIRGGER